MAKDRMEVLELLRKEAPDADLDFLREGLRVLIQGVMGAEVANKTGDGFGERGSERTSYRNGYRARPWDIREGTLELQVPKVREGSYFPSLLKPRRRSERALLAVVQQAYVEGVSLCRIEDVVQAPGCEGISKSQISRIRSELAALVDSFLGRPLGGGPYPYLWLDAVIQKVREDGRIVNVSVVVAAGVNHEGKREVLGIDVGTSEDAAFWLAFLRSLAARVLGGVEMVTSDAHQGLTHAIATVFAGASWQRCRTHFMTNLLSKVPRHAQPQMATVVRTIYQQPSPSPPSPWPTGGRSSRTTRGSTSTRRSDAGRTWCASPPTGLRSGGSSGRSSPSSTTSGRSPAAICRPPRRSAPHGSINVSAHRCNLINQRG